MTREDIQKEIISLKGTNWLLELATGLGKSKLALDKVRSLSKTKKNLLIVVPRNVHKQNWKDEIKKWWPRCKWDITFTTYVSLPKYVGKWDFIIFDECHHLSSRCRAALNDFDIEHSVLLSATVNKNMKEELVKVFNNLTFYKRGLRDVIEDEILPDPKVYLWPLTLKTDLPTEVIIKNKSSKKPIVECSWVTRGKYIWQKEFPVKIYCTQRQYLTDLDNQIKYWKKRYMTTRAPMAQNRWLKLCGDRLKWLSDKKVGLLYQLLEYLKDCRTLTFCNSIDQTEKLGEYCINSKNAASVSYLEDFNNGKIDHITTCNMLNEGRHICLYLPNSVEVKYKNKLRKKA